MPLTVCPFSNVRLRVVDTLADHPLRGPARSRPPGLGPLRRPRLLRWVHRRQLRGRGRPARPRHRGGGADRPEQLQRRVPRRGHQARAPGRHRRVLRPGAAQRRTGGPERARTRAQQGGTVGEDFDRRGHLARAHARGLGGHEGRAAPVDPGGRQGAPRLGAHGQPLVAGSRSMSRPAASPPRSCPTGTGGSRWSSTSSSTSSTSRARTASTAASRWNRVRSPTSTRPRWPLSPRSGSSSRCWHDRSSSPTRHPSSRTPPYAPYDRAAAHRFWLALVQISRVMGVFRARYQGKVSPVHFFWGAADLAVTRFSGRRAPKHPGGVPNCADWVQELAYSHEVSSCGFWPGGSEEGSFYAYAYPVPEGFSAWRGRAVRGVLRRTARRVPAPVPRRPARQRPGRSPAQLLPEHLRRGRRARGVGPGFARGRRQPGSPLTHDSGRRGRAQ